MSKIENALAKARARVVRLETSPSAAEGRSIVPFEQRSLTVQDAERIAARKALARMEEPWLLDSRALEARRIIGMGAADTDVVMVFRELRTKILQTATTNCNIMVTSISRSGDGAFVAANLAVSFALDDSKTAVLLDCSLGDPLFPDLTSSTDALGITDYLKSDEIVLEQIIHPVGVRRLRVIPTGRRHDRVAEYFTSMKMRHLLSELRQRYPDRYIFLGAPPLTESADAHILMELADYVVLVVPYGTVTEAEIADAAKLIGEKKLLGVVFSGVPSLPRGRTTLSGWVAGLLGLRPKRAVERAKRK